MTLTSAVALCAVPHSSHAHAADTETTQVGSDRHRGQRLTAETVHVLTTHCSPAPERGPVNTRPRGTRTDTGTRGCTFRSGGSDLSHGGLDRELYPRTPTQGLLVSLTQALKLTGRSNSDLYRMPCIQILLEYVSYNDFTVK